MPQAYRKNSRKRRKNRSHGDLVKRVAESTGVSIWTVYKVLYKQTKSERVERAIDEARRAAA